MGSSLEIFPRLPFPYFVFVLSFCLPADYKFYVFSEDLNTANAQTQVFKNFLPDYHFTATAVRIKDDNGILSGIGGI